MPNSNLTAEQKFIKYHDKLRDELNRAHTHYEICKTLRKFNGIYLKEINVAPSFFGLTIDANLFATIMSINRLFDKSSDSLKLAGLFKLVENNISIFSDEAYEKRLRNRSRDEEDIKHFMKDHTSITSEIVHRDRINITNLPIQNLKNWRDKKLAHIDKGIVFESIDISKESPIKIGEIDKIINTLHEILNRYMLAYDGTTWIIGTPAAGVEHQIEYIMKSIRFCEESKIMEIRGQIVSPT